MRINVPDHNAYVDFPDDMPEGEIKAAMMQHFPPRPNHDDLTTAAVRGQDSLKLQDISPEVKPAVKMTIDEFANAQIPPTKPFVSLGNGEVYVFAENQLDMKEAIEKILEGDDSEILGYPSREGLEKEEMTDVAVTRTGEIITDLATMKAEAEQGNIIWAAEGAEDDALAKAEAVAKAIKGLSDLNTSGSMGEIGGNQ